MEHATFQEDVHFNSDLNYFILWERNKYNNIDYIVLYNLQTKIAANSHSGPIRIASTAVTTTVRPHGIVAKVLQY